MQPDALELGVAVKLDAPMLAEHGQSAVIVNLHRDQDGQAVTAQVQIDGSGEKRWLHRVSLSPFTHPLEICE